MEKGRVKNKKKFISVLIIPHFASKVKTFKFSAPYTRLITLIAAIILIQTVFIFTFIHIYKENNELERNVADLTISNMEQQNLLAEKIDEIENLSESNDKINATMKEFISKYQEMSDTYITERLESVKTSRSTNGVDRSFVNDLNELKKLMADLDELGAVKSDKLEDLKETEQKLKNYMDSMPTLWPVYGNISSDYGTRSDPIKSWKKTYHTGIDIAADYGKKIKASASGKVALARRTNVYGKTVIIDHGNGIETFYGHASRLLVKEGQAVKKGDVIAEVGSTGRSTGSHLHFEIRVRGNTVDPLKYLD